MITTDRSNTPPRSHAAEGDRSTTASPFLRTFALSFVKTLVSRSATFSFVPRYFSTTSSDVHISRAYCSLTDTWRDILLSSFVFCTVVTWCASDSGLRLTFLTTLSLLNSPGSAFRFDLLKSLVVGSVLRSHCKCLPNRGVCPWPYDRGSLHTLRASPRESS